MTWAPARTLVTVPGQRPYVKVAGNGVDTIHFAFTQGHPRERGEQHLLRPLPGRQPVPGERDADHVAGQRADRAVPGRSRLQRRRAWRRESLGARRRARRRRPAGDHLRHVPDEQRPSLSLRPLGRHPLGRPGDRPGRSLDERRHRRTELLRRHHPRPREPVHGLPGPAGRRRLRGGAVAYRRRRGDLDPPAGHGQLGPRQLPADLAARPDRRRPQRGLDARRLPQLHPVPDGDRRRDAQPRRVRPVRGRGGRRPAAGARRRRHRWPAPQVLRRHLERMGERRPRARGQHHGTAGGHLVRDRPPRRRRDRGVAPGTCCTGPGSAAGGAPGPTAAPVRAAIGSAGPRSPPRHLAGWRSSPATA